MTAEDKGENGSVASARAAVEPEAGRAPKKDTTALSNALRANLQRRKQALRARKQNGAAPDGGPAAEDEATWTR